jgi:hypothetical protein
MNCSKLSEYISTIYFANGVDTEGKVNFEGLGSTGYVAGPKLGWLLQMEFLKG